MNDFLLIFRRDFMNKQAQPSPEALQNSIKAWQNWFGGIAAQNKLVRPLQRWDIAGNVVKSDKHVINGPYVEIKESIGGLILIRAENYEEAIQIAQNCPILELGGNVEVRMADNPEG